MDLVFCPPPELEVRGAPGMDYWPGVLLLMLAYDSPFQGED